MAPISSCSVSCLLTERVFTKVIVRSGFTTSLNPTFERAISMRRSLRRSKLRGDALAGYILAKARDGYQVVFSVGELDPALRDNQILLADRSDGRPLVDDQAPVRLAAPHEQRRARSVRMLAELQVVRLRN
jgi:hypothetical protein